MHDEGGDEGVGGGAGEAREVAVVVDALDGVGEGLGSGVELFKSWRWWGRVNCRHHEGRVEAELRVWWLRGGAPSQPVCTFSSQIYNHIGNR